MRILVVCFLLGFFSQLNGQVKHEVKLPVFPILNKTLIPSYELITNNEKFGIEIGAGINFSNASHRVMIDSTVIGTFGETNFIFEEYRKREFKSSLALKYYWNFNVNKRFISVFAGPYFEYDSVLFLEDEYIQKRIEWAAEDENRNADFIGQGKFRPGIKSGAKLIFKNNLVIELSGVFSLEYCELTPNDFVMRQGFFYLYPTFKVGYRFGDHPLSELPE